MEDFVKCYICGTTYDRDKQDECPCCSWWFLGFENELSQNEYEEINHTTIAKAKENFKNGLDKWGDPLKR